MSERWTVSGVVLLIALMAGRFFWSELERAPVPVEKVESGRRAPNFSLPETNGGRVTLDSYRGQPVLLVFWTTANSDCQRELPLVSRLAPEIRGKGIAVVTIYVGDEVGAAKQYLRENNVAVLSLVDTDGEVAESYNVGGVPKLVLIASDGKIVRAHQGAAAEALLREWMDSVHPS